MADASEVAASAASSSERRKPQVAESAASVGDEFQHEYDEAHMQDMTQQERGHAAQSHRIHKLGKAFQNYRRAQLKNLAEMQVKKICLMGLLPRQHLCMEDLVWSEDDMEHFLHTICSFETHEHLWKEQREVR